MKNINYRSVKNNKNLNKTGEIRVAQVIDVTQMTHFRTLIYDHEVSFCIRSL